MIHVLAVSLHGSRELSIILRVLCRGRKGGLAMKTHTSRRDFLGALGMTAGACLAQPNLLRAQRLPASRVAVGMCPEYTHRVVDVLSAMFDQLGGIDRLVRG